jgi:hypothetical protein
MTERLLDRYLEVAIGPAERADVLTALRRHLLDTLVVGLEGPDGRLLLLAEGTLLTAEEGAVPDTCEVFALDQERRFVNQYGLDPETKDRLRAEGRSLGPERPPTLQALTIPDDGLEGYSGGYRLRLPGGYALALVLLHEGMHLTPSGDVVPLRAEPFDWDDEDADEEEE